MVVLDRISVDRFRGPAVHPPIGLVVPGDVDTLGAYTHVHRLLPDGGRDRALLPADLPGLSDIDRHDAAEEVLSHHRGVDRHNSTGDSSRALCMVTGSQRQSRRDEATTLSRPETPAAGHVGVGSVSTPRY